MPRLDYVSQTATEVSVTYADMPPKTEVVFVNTTSAAKTPSQSPPLSGSGTANIPIPKLAPGQYYLLAQDQAGERLAQTVPFYIN